jgi:nucleoside-diphosphate-sugar epimerase
MKKKILIIGGTGFLGFHLCKSSASKGFKTFSVSRKKPRLDRKINKVKYILCDISKKKEIKKKLDQNFDYVVNLGGEVDHSNKVKTYKSHFIGCKNLAEFFVKKKIKLFIQVGSSAENAFLKPPHSETLNGKPKTSYGKAKLAATKFLFKKKIKNNLKFVIFRLYQIYGPYQDTNRFIPILIDSCMKKKIFECSNGDQFRDFLYIDDLISVFFKALKSKKIIHKIINVGSGQPKKLRYITNKVINFFKSPEPKYGVIKLRNDEAKLIYPRITSVKRLLKWKPKTKFNTGLIKTINYYKKSQND